MNKELALIPVSAGSEASYIQRVSSIPMLTVEEEQQLATQLRDNNDLEAARRLVLSHLRFVVQVAKGYSGYGLALSDLIQEGNIGLMKAVKRFDPEHGVRLVSFAVHWIRAEIHEFILRNWRIVKVATTKAQRKLFFNLRSKKKRLGWLNHAEVNQVAEDLGVKPETVLEMEKRMSGIDITFDAPGGDDDHVLPAPAQYLEADSMSDPAIYAEALDGENHHNSRLAAALETLDERSKDIVMQRWLSEKKLTLEVLADRYGVSAERIRQLEKNALQKLRNAFE